MYAEKPLLARLHSEASRADYDDTRKTVKDAVSEIERLREELYSLKAACKEQYMLGVEGGKAEYRERLIAAEDELAAHDKQVRDAALEEAALFCDDKMDISGRLCSGHIRAMKG